MISSLSSPSSVSSRASPLMLSKTQTVIEPYDHKKRTARASVWIADAQRAYILQQNQSITTPKWQKSILVRWYGALSRFSKPKRRRGDDISTSGEEASEAPNLTPVEFALQHLAPETQKALSDYIRSVELVSMRRWSWSREDLSDKETLSLLQRALKTLEESERIKKYDLIGRCRVYVQRLAFAMAYVKTSPNPIMDKRLEEQKQSEEDNNEAKTSENTNVAVRDTNVSCDVATSGLTDRQKAGLKSHAFLTDGRGGFRHLQVPRALSTGIRAMRSVSRIDFGGGLVASLKLIPPVAGNEDEDFSLSIVAGRMFGKACISVSLIACTIHIVIAATCIVLLYMLRILEIPLKIAVQHRTYRTRISRL